MARRKTILYGQKLNERFETALGLPEYEQARVLLKQTEFEYPKIDWVAVEAKVDHEISQYSKRKINEAFDGEIGQRVINGVATALSGERPMLNMSETDFQRKARRIEELSQKLASEIDDLVEIGSLLIVRPKPKDGLTEQPHLSGPI